MLKEDIFQRITWLVENHSWSEVLHGTPREKGSFLSMEWKYGKCTFNTSSALGPRMISQSGWLSSILRLAQRRTQNQLSIDAYRVYLSLVPPNKSINNTNT
jgi:hypothetical protein